MISHFAMLINVPRNYSYDKFGSYGLLQENTRSIIADCLLKLDSVHTYSIRHKHHYILAQATALSSQKRNQTFC
jgi:hypothetical protein